MDEDRLKQQLFALDQWRSNLIGAIENVNQWLTHNKMSTTESDLKLFDAIETVRSDRLTIAFVAEFSRGKTELINAIFFADYKRRLLPSTVGRTTMCPTELFYDQHEATSYIRLLPIESRSMDRSIADLKKDLDAWTTLTLDTNSPQQMAERLQEVVKFKNVPVEEARRLGLYNDEMAEEDAKSGNVPTHVDIPVWRHALISFPHPLLKQGLVILDTPGLNALGTEPELTLSMLPAAQAVVFVLAPDTGVTKSDLDIWQIYIKGALDSENPKGVVAALNKIDTLWDEMMDEAEINAVIEKQCRKTAEMLGIDEQNVLPVSAQKALVAKAKGDHQLLQKSRILALETLLADEIVPAKQRIVGSHIIHEVGGMVGQTREMVQAQREKLTNQLEALRSASGRNTDVIKHLTQKTREQQIAYNNNMKYLQSSRRALAQHTIAVMNELSLEAFDMLISKTRRDMEESWTTGGLKKGMKTLFDGVNETMQVVYRQMSETHELVENVYRKFHEDHGLPKMEFPKFSVDGYRADLKKVAEKGEEFRNSTMTTMTEQSFVVKKFFISIVSHAREIFFRVHSDADKWLKEIMNPLIAQIHIHKQLLEQHLDTLCKINETRETLSKNVSSLEAQCKALEKQIKELDDLERNLHAQAIDEDVADAASEAGSPVAAVAEDATA